MLEVKELVKSYGTGKNQHRVLRGVNFTIHKGEFVAVMGPSGSGKTTLLDCISQYKPFESGEVLLDGVDLGKLNEKEMAKVPLLRLWMRYIHCLFLDRSNVKEGLKTILAGVDELKNGHSIWIFPEGTRNRGEEGSMLEFKEGSLKMADKAGCPVVPVAIAHSADVLENHFPFIRRAAITIRFGEPIDLKSLPREQKKQAGAYTRTIIQAMLDDILKED